MRGEGVLIAGGGLAGQRCAETLRSRGYDGRIRIVCGEPELPYDRPPLSKALLAPGADEGEAHFRDAAWYAENEVELLLGERAGSLDFRSRQVALEAGSSLGYETLLIATGATPRRLPLFEGYANVHYLRAIDDARRLRAELKPGARLAIVGAGFIGLEVAAAAAAVGADVTVLEALPLPLAGLIGVELGRWFVELHRAEGVRMLLSARVTEARGLGRVEELELDDGRVVGCDAVLVGIGALPASTWLRSSGLDDDGVLTDPAGRTALADVFAAGDVARPFDRRSQRNVRTEHWDAASRQGAVVGRAMLGDEPGPQPLPSFWSDQYGLRIQYVGDASGADEVRLEGDPAEREFSVLFSRARRPVAGLAVNQPRRLVALRRQIELGTSEIEIQEEAA